MNHLHGNLIDEFIRDGDTKVHEKFHELDYDSENSLLFVD